MSPVFEVRIAQWLVDGLWERLSEGLTFGDLLAFAVVAFVRSSMGRPPARPEKGLADEVPVRALVPLGVRLELKALADRRGASTDDIVAGAVAASLPRLGSGAAPVTGAWDLIYAARDQRLEIALSRLAKKRVDVFTDSWLLATLIDCQSAVAHSGGVTGDTAQAEAALRLVEKEVARRGLDVLHGSMTPGFRSSRTSRAARSKR